MARDEVGGAEEVEVFRGVFCGVSVCRESDEVIMGTGGWGDGYFIVSEVYVLPWGAYELECGVGP